MTPQDSEKLKAAVRAMQKALKQIEALLPDANDGPIDIAPEVLALVSERTKNRICLACLQPLAPGEKDKRGNHISCYNTLRLRIRNGTETERNLIQQGKMQAEGRKPGRTAKIDLAAATEIAAEVTQRAAKKRRSE